MADIRELLGAQTFEAVEKKLRAEITLSIEALKSKSDSPEVSYYLDEAIAIAKGGKR